jgi:hypothetical protein
MAWSIVGVGASVEVTATNHTLTLPAGVAQGDLLVACISSRIASTTSITLPTGGEWTLVGEQKANNILSTGSAVASGMMAYCVRGAGNPNLTFTHPAAPAPALGRIVAYRGGATPTASAKDTQGAATTAVSITAVNLAGLTTTAANDLIVAMLAGGQEAAWSSFNATTPAGASGATDTTTAPSTTTWIERADVQTTTGNDTSLGIFDAVKTAAGATGNFTATASVAASHALVAGAFKIAPTVNVSVTVTDQAVTASVGAATVSAVQNASVTIIGQELTVSAGTVTVPVPFIGQRSYFIGSPLGAAYVAETGDDSYALPAGYVTESYGVAAAISVSVNVTGQAAAVSVGDVSVTTANAVTVPVIGQAVTASVGTATVTANQTVSVSVTGQAVTAAVGTATIDIPGTAFTGQRSYFIGSSFGTTYVNETGSSSYALPDGYVSETYSAPAAAGLITVWTGSAWVDKPMMVWTGSAWMQKPLKRWNGSAWV